MALGHFLPVFYNISISDLETLSDKGKERLREWWKPNVNDRLASKHGQMWSINRWVGDKYKLAVVKGNSNQPNSWAAHGYKNIASMRKVIQEDDLFLPLLSIGQMFEYLCEKSEDKFTKIGPHGPHIHELQWVDDELCDTLWKNVKTVLEQ